MTKEAELVMNVWEAVRDTIPHTKRGDVAKEILYHFADFGFEPTELVSIADEDPDLGEAFDEVFPATDYEDEEDEEE